MTTSTLADRARGALLGLATGDALGAAIEFARPGTFKPIEDLIGGGPFGLPPGAWTDDTSMALCLGESLAELGRFDPRDQLDRYLRWWRDGYMSSTGRCFDIGTTTSASLSRYERTGEPNAVGAGGSSAGNGSLMRLAPVPLAFHRDARAAVHHAGESSRTTHAAAACVDACRYFAGLLVGALHGVPKDELLRSRWSPVPGVWDEAPLVEEVDEVAAGSFLEREPPAIVGSGYVVRSLEAALWAFARTDSFADGVLAAVNLGDDADTTGAVFGQIGGAYYGASAIPERWRERLVQREFIEGLADRLLRAGERSAG